MDFVEMYYSDSMYGNDSADMYEAKKKAFSLVIGAIMEHELTEKQSVCLRYRYVNNMTQEEIAQKLKISQPSVSRHITAGKNAVNSKLKYCYLALSKGLAEFEKTYH